MNSRSPGATRTVWRTSQRRRGSPTAAALCTAAILYVACRGWTHALALTMRRARYTPQVLTMYRRFVGYTLMASRGGS